VLATGYVTRAERRGDAPVFHPADQTDGSDASAWWQLTRGADHRHPEARGEQSRANEPVVQVAYEDALAYARWLGHNLPTEAQWELAARAGRSDDSLHRAPRADDGKPLANFWQGSFPATDSGEDGFRGGAPVGCHPPNSSGLFDTVDNVWEWTSEPYLGSHRDRAQADHTQLRSDVARVIKGGSYLCSADYCARYRVSARHRQEPDLSGPHLGFRTVRAP
jgi:formylglycine-generating enzyme